MIEEPILRESFAYKDLSGFDEWITWTPVRISWSDVGTPTVDGRFHIVGKQCFFQVEVIPGTTVSTTAGVSYVELPITAEGLVGDASMVNLTSSVAIGTCVIDTTNSRVYTPTQSATANTVAIGGWYEI